MRRERRPNAIPETTTTPDGADVRDAKSAAAHVDALRRRAARLVERDARFLGLAGAGATLVVAAFLTSGAVAAGAAVGCFLTFSLVGRFLSFRRAPRVHLAARRIETLFPTALGCVTAALENLERSELADETRRRAAAAVAAVAARSDEEIFGILLNRGFDAESTRRRARRRRVLRAVATTLAGIAVATFGAVEYHRAVSSVSGRGPEAPVAVDSEAPPVPRASDGRPKENAEPDDAPPGVSDEPSDAAQKSSLERTSSAVAALVSDLARAENLARRFADELDAGTESDPALEVAFARELDRETATLRNRAAAVAGSASDALHDDSDAAARAFLTVRRAREALAFFERDRETTGAWTSALDAARRGTGRPLDVAAFVDRLAAERRAFSILDASWRFAVADVSATSALEATRREAARTLALRAGTTPDETTAAATRAFFAMTARSRDALSETTALFDETRRLLAASDASEFVAFARRVADDAALAALCFDVGEGNASGRLDGAAKRLEDAENEARLERWGRAASILGASPVFESRAAETERDALAIRLTFGAIPAPGAEYDAPDAVDLETVSDGDSRDGELVSIMENAAIQDALEREGARGAEAAKLGDVAPSRRAPEGAVEGDGSSGVLSETGSSPDAEFAGGGEKGESGAYERIFSGTPFLAELPQDDRQRLEKAQQWSPPPEYLRRAERFRRELRSALSE